MDRLTVDCGKSFQPFRYAMKDGSDSEPGYFKDYDAFFSHMMLVQKLGEYEDLEELIGIPLKELAEIFRQHIPDGCQHPQKAIVLTDGDVDKWRSMTSNGETAAAE